MLSLMRGYNIHRTNCFACTIQKTDRQSAKCFKILFLFKEREQEQESSR